MQTTYFAVYACVQSVTQFFNKGAYFHISGYIDEDSLVYLRSFFRKMWQHYRLTTILLSALASVTTILLLALCVGCCCRERRRASRTKRDAQRPSPTKVPPPQPTRPLPSPPPNRRRNNNIYSCMPRSYTVTEQEDEERGVARRAAASALSPVARNKTHLKAKIERVLEGLRVQHRQEQQQELELISATTRSPSPPPLTYQLLAGREAAAEAAATEVEATSSVMGASAL